MNRPRFHGLWPAHLKARKGIALLITLLVTGLLSASALSFIRMANLEARVADNTYTLAQAEILAQAGLKGAIALPGLISTDSRPWPVCFSRKAVLRERSRIFPAA
ncbi:MAG: pilus assembly PilX N-terminal domain-containing protein [Deltaproteobacteria bacterium]|nr:pilus assembly PilX N-terminal domain-containing protein [Deltaproteobacteria bacterium]